MKILFTYILGLLSSIAIAQNIAHTICSNDDGIKRYFVNNAIPSANYIWSLNSGGTINGQLNDTLYVTWNGIPGIYSLSVFADLGTNCISDTAYYYIEIIDAPVITVSDIPEFCAGESVTISANGSNSYLWSSGQSSATITISPSQNTSLWLIGTTGNCSSDTLFIDLNPVPKPLAAFSPSPSFGQVPLTVLFSNQSSNAESFEWNFGDGNSSSAESPEYTYSDTGSYTVQLTAFNSLGCSNSISFSFIKVLEAFLIYVPNAFTPNGDALNAVFRPFMNTEVEYTLRIYSRWGDLLFGMTGTDISWDGTFKGKILKEDVYVWQINLTDPVIQEKRVFRGRVMLMQ